MSHRTLAPLENVGIQNLHYSFVKQRLVIICYQNLNMMTQVTKMLTSTAIMKCNKVCFTIT